MRVGSQWQQLCEEVDDIRLQLKIFREKGDYLNEKLVEQCRGCEREKTHQISKAVSLEQVRFLLELKCEGKSRNELRTNALDSPTQPKKDF